MSASRFNDLSDQERALLAFGLGLLFVELNIGLISPGPADPDVLERDVPAIARLFDELGAPFGHTLDKDLIATYNAFVSQQAAARREHGG